MHIYIHVMYLFILNALTCVEDWSMKVTSSWLLPLRHCLHHSAWCHRRPWWPLDYNRDQTKRSGGRFILPFESECFIRRWKVCRRYYYCISHLKILKVHCKIVSMKWSDRLGLVDGMYHHHSHLHATGSTVSWFFSVAGLWLVRRRNKKRGAAGDPQWALLDSKKRQHASGSSTRQNLGRMRYSCCSSSSLHHYLLLGSHQI